MTTVMGLSCRAAPTRVRGCLADASGPSAMRNRPEVRRACGEATRPARPAAPASTPPGAVAFAAIPFQRRDCRHENPPPAPCSPPTVRLCWLFASHPTSSSSRSAGTCASACPTATSRSCSPSAASRLTMSPSTGGCCASRRCRHAMGSHWQVDRPISRWLAAGGMYRALPDLRCSAHPAKFLNPTGGSPGRSGAERRPRGGATVAGYPAGVGRSA
jgi:hypothetical protein